ncbi:MAG: hypothetical protein FWH26_06810 [Oscillospiraceae bacterium]|nr:hypothetical protein [Oscillospiraceae bacterium]
MKKAISILLALCLTCAFGATVSAATKDTTVTATVEFSYTVEVPAVITLTFGDTDSAQYDITASEVAVPSNIKLSISAEGNGTDKAFSITNGTDTVPYTLSRKNAGSALEPGAEIASFANDGSSPFWIKVPTWSAVRSAGLYTGNIIFTIGVEEKFDTEPAIAMGSNHTVYLRSDGTVWTWGANWVGQLGYMLPEPEYYKATPSQVMDLSGIIAVSAGGSFSLALSSDGTVWSWGDNSNGQLGIGSTEIADGVQQVLGLESIIAISAGNDFGAALSSDGFVWTWGRNNYMQLGSGTDTNRSIAGQVLGEGGSGFLTGIEKIAAGYDYMLALKSNGTVWSWGGNSAGSLGIGTSGFSERKSSPVQVHGIGGVGVLTGIQNIAAGGSISLTVKASDGSMAAWGHNRYGQLGDGTDDNNRESPVAVVGLTGVTAVSAGNYHAVALKSDGTVYTWGWNRSGQLGDGSDTDSNVPKRVIAVSNAVAVAANGESTAIVKSDGSVWAWGYNDAGQLGDGTIIDRYAPKQVVFS